MGLFDGLPTLADRPRCAVQKGPTRLEERIAKRPLVTVTEQDFRRQVWARDKHWCRCCGRKVQQILGRVPERGEVHHVHGRVGDLRFEVRAAILLCLSCHERVTGRVNQSRLIIVPSQTFTTRDHVYTDATYPVRFTP